jgi:7-cyano-7-deazaguanine synthase
MNHKKPILPKALAVISGGLDSTIALFMAKKNYTIPYAVIFDYGHRAFRMELQACRKLVRPLSIKLFVIDLSWLSGLSASSLVSAKKTVPHLKRDDLKNMDLLKKTANSVLVQNRNMIFLSCAAGIALEKGCSALVVGFNAEEAMTFPDNSNSFVQSINETLAVSVSPRKIRVLSPVQHKKKKDIVRYAISNKISLNTVYSCYLGERLMCGACESCVRLKNALMLNNYLQGSGIIFKNEK